MDEVYDLLRWANAFLFVLAALMLGIRTRTIWPKQNTGGKRLLLGLCILFAVLAYGTAEAYVLGAQPGVRIFLITAAMLGVIHGLWNLRHDQTPWKVD